MPSCWTAVSALIPALLLACNDGKDEPSCPGAGCDEVCGNGADDDGDGASDCLDPACSAACPEDCVNGVDDDQDWLIDCADEGCSSTCDGDGDGWYGVGVTAEDCDDTDDSVHPEAPEVYYDGADNDCDPATVDDDQDADGWLVDADCDDLNANSWPGAPELCGDGVPNDCAGAPPGREICFGSRSLGTADYILDGSEDQSGAGFSVAGVGDQDNDGGIEIVVGAPFSGEEDQGATFRVSWPLPRVGDLRTIGCELTGVGDIDYLGYRVDPLGEMDTVQGPDAGLGAPQANVPNRGGALYVLGAGCFGPDTVGGSALEIAGFDNNNLGTAFAVAGDRNGDARPDLAVGMPSEFGSTDPGAVALFAGPIPGALTPDDALSVLLGDQPASRTGQMVRLAGDVDGDGVSDLLVGAPEYDATGPNSGVLYVVTDIPPGESALSDSLTLPLGAPNDQFGFASPLEPADFDDDGYEDPVVSAPYADRIAAEAGLVVILDVHTGVSEEIALLDGKLAGDTFGFSVSTIGDLDGDGRRDLVVGAPGADPDGVENAGTAYIYFGPYAGALGTEEAGVILVGEAEADFAGTSVASAGDMNGDGVDDLLVGAPYHNGAQPGAGRVYLLTFEL